MNEVDTILKGSKFKLEKLDQVILSQLKKKLRGEDDREWVQTFLELEGPVEQKEGKKSYRYMQKKYWEI